MPWLTLPDNVQSKCSPTDSHTPWTMCAGLGWWCIPLANITLYMSSSHVRCMQDLTDAFCCWLMSFSQRQNVSPNGACHRQKSISLSRWTQATIYASMTFMMLHDIIRCCLFYAQKTYQMHEDLSWCCLPFADTALMMPVDHDRCCKDIPHTLRLMRAGMQALDEVAYHLSMSPC